MVNWFQFSCNIQKHLILPLSGVDTLSTVLLLTASGFFTLGGGLGGFLRGIAYVGLLSKLSSVGFSMSLRFGDGLGDDWVVGLEGRESTM